MKISSKKMFLLSISLLILIALAACGNQSEPAGKKEENQTGSDGLIITNMERTVTYTEVPKRVVSLNQHATEIMLALGLEDSMVGTAYLDDQILPEFEEKYNNIPVLAKEYPSTEVFLATEPDFAYAGWKNAFTEKTLGTVEELEELGIKTYIQESSNKTAPTLEEVYKDIGNIGRIFHVEKKAEEVINQMKKDIEEITNQIGAVEKPLNVFVYDSGEDKPFTAANNYLTNLIKIAGARNIFDDIQKGWADVSWEEVVNRNPDVIVIIDYGDISVKQKQELLLSKKELADIPAVKNKQFVILPLSAGAEGIRAPYALKTLAEGFYPNKF
ncbi:ABC transporter substrate-binding protein [Metabacillus fastidiosus]|uniref:ABC transporter substrate-binding protein n=1 Tax=Metabacillus fastidiosus TaxID=1458 RepID=UPI000824221E|nr:ABC transporter substrate-binding protein [Metabacillus fastidiosus]MED4461355.1 ABC transporter substrate-binding protein [Metabacillus fastidiosus]